MRYFQKLRDNIDTAQLFNMLMRNQQFFDTDTIRTTTPGTPHTEVHDILMRFGEHNLDSIIMWDRNPMKAMPEFKDVALTIMAVMKGVQLGRVIITKLPPGKKIASHKDEGNTAIFYTRTHLVLHGRPGNLFTCGDETVQMLTGELWWFNNKEEHSCANNSDDDRIHMIVDIRVDH